MIGCLVKGDVFFLRGCPSANVAGSVRLNEVKSRSFVVFRYLACDIRLDIQIDIRIDIRTLIASYKKTIKYI